MIHRLACLLALVVLTAGCAGVPFGSHRPLTAGEQDLRAALPVTSQASQSRWRATLDLGEPVELTLLVRVDGPGSGRVAATDDLGLRLFDIAAHPGGTTVHELARGLPEEPLTELVRLLVDCQAWAPDWPAVRTDDGRAALARGLRPGHEPILRVSPRPPANLPVLDDTDDDALWLELGVAGERLGWVRLQAWTSGPAGRLVYPARLRVGVPGEVGRLDARAQSWSPREVSATPVDC